ncbi:helix-turn-helix domain-containing protein [Bacillus weihaiensis]|uniref:Helix-turn-helix domain-containing protein n=1 Tax=Bacillus weihaiensis TaxID=1547283 RepID=A0A1L3MVR8_9BACI|nr:helix-turn-helix domain-containing protein [Bacillus weihaiensis]APH06434.1 hypothetical protein A9C19_17790 [Bacillus weihaiensis]
MAKFKRFSYEAVKGYQSFSSVEEMDKAVRGFLYHHKQELSEGTLKVLTFIWTHSTKVIGVSFAKHETIAKDVGLSRRTVMRAIHKLESLRILSKIPTIRPNGKQGVNILVIQPYQSIDELVSTMSPHDVTVCVTPSDTKNKQHSLCENKKQKPINVSSESSDKILEDKQANLESVSASDSEEGQIHKNTTVHRGSSPLEISDACIDSSFLPESVHKEFIEAANPFFPTNEIYSLWNRVNIVAKKVNLNRHIDEVIAPVISALKQTIFQQKQNKIHSTFHGYFYRLVYHNLIIEKRRENRDMLYDFIGEG